MNRPKGLHCVTASCPRRFRPTLLGGSSGRCGIHNPSPARLHWGKVGFVDDAAIASDSSFESIQMGGPMGDATVSIFDIKTRKLIRQYNQKAIDLTSTPPSSPNSNSIPEQIITQSQYDDDDDGSTLSESSWFQSIKMKNPYQQQTWKKKSTFFIR